MLSDACSGSHTDGCAGVAAVAGEGVELEVGDGVGLDDVSIGAASPRTASITAHTANPSPTSTISARSPTTIRRRR